MNTSKSLAIFFFAFAATHALSQTVATGAVKATSATDLKVGDQAPKLEPFRVVKGQPVKLGNGKVNVVEFWATWCGPCKKSIPHLTELAHKYGGKVSFTGVSVSEVHRGDDFTAVPDRVSTFVKTMGSSMDYNVVMDGAKATINTAWMEAAGQDGIPTAFVVDQKGRIAWIGHPMDNLDKVLDGVIDGSWDIKKEAKKGAEALAVKKDMMAVGAILQSAFQSGDTKKMLAALDVAIEKYPRLTVQLGTTKFGVLMQAGEVAAACEYADKKLFTALNDDAMNLNQVAWGLVEKEALKGADYNIAVKFAKRAVELTGAKDANILDTLGLSYYRAGDKAHAVETETLAVARAKDDASIDISTKKELAARLELFKKP